MRVNKIKLLKLIDKIIGKTLVLSLPEKAKSDYLTLSSLLNKPDSIKAILLIRPGGIGDAVLLTPSIKILKSKFPNSQIHILCEKRNSGIFSLTKEVNEVYHYDKDFEILKCLKNKYDIVIDTEQWHRLSAVIGYLTRSPIRIGFDTNERKKLFTDRIPYSHEEYEVYSFFHLIEPLIGEKITNFEEPFIDISEEDCLSLNGNNDKIAIFPGATITERRWGATKYGEVAKRLSKKGFKILILGSKNDTKDANKICEYSDNIFNMAGKTTLQQVACILKKCKLLISGDTGLLHLAYAVGTPTVSIFGSGIEKKWAPRGDKHVVLNKHLDCSPCTRFGYTPKCKNGVLCLSLITVEDVMRAVDKILSN